MSEFEKKSERIEIRVSHSKKEAFNAACESNGDTPSGALRRFIDGYIKRAESDAFAEGLRALGRMARRRWLPLTAVAAALLVSGYFTGKALRPAPQDGPIVTASTEEFPTINYALFAAYDKNANGVLDLGEVADNDEHLHRVLNLDGEAGISPAEFYEIGNMDWSFIKKDSVELNRNEDGPVAITESSEYELARQVVFDLTNVASPSIQVSSRDLGTPVNLDDIPEELRHKIPAGIKDIKMTTSFSDRSVSWERGKTIPVLSTSNPEFRVRGTSAHEFPLTTLSNL